MKLAVESKPAFASKAYKYTVSDSSVAAVSSNGEITAKKIGKCVVTVTSKVDPSVKTKVTVKVLPAAVSSVETVYASKKAVNIKWSSVEGAAGYEVYILRGGEKKLLFTTGKTSGKVSGLASKTEYTIFVRAYADVGSAKYRSAYCKAVIKTK